MSASVALCTTSEIFILKYVLSISLGSTETTLLKLTSAYCTFVNGGKLIEPIIIDRIQDGEGNTIINNENRKCINCDQIFEWDTKELEQLIKDQPNTSWLTVYQSLDEARHSFALPKVEGLNIFDKYDETYARVNHVSEKTRLGTTSPTATTGFYHFASGKVFKQCVDHALTEPPQYGGEYYMGPIYNELIKRNHNVCMYKVEKPTFWPTGTVADYIEYNHYWVSK